MKRILTPIVALTLALGSAMSARPAAALDLGIGSNTHVGASANTGASASGDFNGNAVGSDNIRARNRVNAGFDADTNVESDMYNDRRAHSYERARGNSRTETQGNVGASSNTTYRMQSHDYSSADANARLGADVGVDADTRFDGNALGSSRTVQLNNGLGLSLGSRVGDSFNE